MNYNKAYKFRIYPTNDQELLLNKTFGSCRFVWNNALSYRNDLFASRKEFYNKYDSMKDLASIKNITEYSWLKEVDSVALQQTLNDLDTAFNNFYRKRKQTKQKTSVNFKCKDNKQSYRTININNNIRLNFKTKRIKLPKLGLVRFRDLRTFEHKIKSATISKTKTSKFFVSLLVEYNFEPNKPMLVETGKVFSADMSAKNFMVSEEIEFENQKFYRNSERRIQIRQRKLSKKKKGSKNQLKHKHRIASTHEKITNKRKGFQRNLSHQLISQFDILCFEDLNMEGMKSFNKGLAKTVSMDFSWSEFLSFLEWKAFKHNKHFVKIDRWFPSSKMCSECGTIKENLELKDRTFKCECGFILDRDLNAARNIKQVGLNQLKQNEGDNLLKKPTGLMPESYAYGDMIHVYQPMNPLPLGSGSSIFK